MARRNNGCVIFRLRIHTRTYVQTIECLLQKTLTCVSFDTICQNVKMSCTPRQVKRYLNSTHKMNVYVVVIRSRGSCNS